MQRRPCVAGLVRFLGLVRVRPDWTLWEEAERRCSGPREKAQRLRHVANAATSQRPS